jgi:hypothetical protein
MPVLNEQGTFNRLSYDRKSTHNTTQGAGKTTQHETTQRNKTKHNTHIHQRGDSEVIGGPQTHRKFGGQTSRGIFGPGEEDKALNDAMFQVSFLVRIWHQTGLFAFEKTWGGSHLPRALSDTKLDHSLKRGWNGGVASDVTKTLILTVDAKTMRTQTEFVITNHVSPAKHEGIDSRHIMSHKIEKWKDRQTQMEKIPRLVWPVLTQRQPIRPKPPVPNR